MTENKTIGVYYVDTTDLEGWTNETLAAALREPLGELGIEIEIGQSNFANPVIYDNVLPGAVDSILDQLKYIVDEVGSQ